jgi:phage tail-like protein
MATGFVKNAHRIDPYKTFKFRVFWDGRPVLGVNKVGALKRTTHVITHREGGENSWDHKTPGRTTYDGLTLERGITHDTEFEKWANLVHSFNGDAVMDLVKFRKDLELVLYNERGQAALRYFLFGCWVSEFTALPALDAGENAIAVEQMKIELYGFARDADTKEPDEAGAVPAG